MCGSIGPEKSLSYDLIGSLALEMISKAKKSDLENNN